MTSAEVLASLPPLQVSGRVDKVRSVMAEQGLDGDGAAPFANIGDAP